MAFTHLHVHTEFSLLDGFCKIKELPGVVKSMGQTACAITDHGVMYGVIDFYRACKAEGVKPIIGCEVYVAPQGRTRFDKVQREPPSGAAVRKRGGLPQPLLHGVSCLDGGLLCETPY